MHSRLLLALVACIAAALIGILWWPSANEDHRTSVDLGALFADSEVQELYELRGSKASREVALGTPESTRSEVASSKAPTPTKFTNGGSVYGRVLNHSDEGVPGVGVQLYRRGAIVDEVSDATGHFRFEGLPDGGYRLLVNKRSMPEGILPPWRQDILREYSGVPTGIFGTTCRVVRGADLEVDLRVFEAGEITGKLVGSFESPVSAVEITIRSQQGQSRSGTGITQSTRTDESGNYKLSNVYPADYLVSAQLSSSASTLPAYFSLRPGESLKLDDLVTSSEGSVLRGLVVDQNGRPVSGVSILCTSESKLKPAPRWKARTDSDGFYELGRVSAQDLLINVERERMTEDGEVERLTKVIPPVRIDARAASPVIEVDTIEVQRPEKFQLLGRVRVDLSWARDHHFEDATIAVQVDGSGAVGEMILEPTRLRRFDSDWGYDFTWNCVTSRDPFEIEVLLRNSLGEEHKRRVEIHPVLNTAETAMVLFP